MSFLMGYVAGMATSSSRNSSRHNFEEERLKTKCKELKQQIKRLQEQLEIATEALKEYSWGNNWLDAGARGQVFLPTKRGYSIADKALDEMEEE